MRALLCCLCLLAAAAPSHAGEREREVADLIEQLRAAPDERAWAIFRGADKADQSLRLATERLTKIGAPAVEPLLAALVADDKSLQIGASFALAGMGETGKQAIPIIVPRLANDLDYGLDHSASDALARFGKVAVPDLVKALQHENAQVRHRAATLLGRIAAPDKDAIAALVVALRDPHTSPQVAAMGALTNIGQPSVGPLMRALDEQENVRESHSFICNILRDLGPTAREAVPVLEKKLTAPYPVCEHATYALEAIRVEKTCGELRSKDAEVKLHAAWILAEGYWRNGCTQEEGRAAVLALSRALHDEDERIREHAATGLRDTPAWANLSLGALVTALGDASPHVRGDAVISLGTLRAKATDALPALKSMLDDPDESVRKYAAVAIERIEYPSRHIPCDA